VASICVLVCTYRRIPELLRLLRQIEAFRSCYSGSNSYSLWVANSDRDNSELLWAHLKESYGVDRMVTNPGVGFDANIFNFYANYSADFDYTLSVSDDDLFVSSQVHPFDVIDAIVVTQRAVVLFNHYDFILSKGGGVSRGYYDGRLLVYGGESLKNCFLRLLPRHCGILYSSGAIRSVVNCLGDFLNTQHLYSVPFLLAAMRGEVLFFDYPMFLFSVDNENGGAWDSRVKVFEGLVRFLIIFRKYLSNVEYAIAKDGFLTNYLGEGAWLRADLEARGLLQRKHEELVRLL
jgi:hypothetical protein